MFCVTEREERKAREEEENANKPEKKVFFITYFDLFIITYFDLNYYLLLLLSFNKGCI